MVQVFISYARDDDLTPEKDGVKGFVTYLDEQLRLELTDLGAPRPTLWRDKRRIDAAEQFDPKIAEGIQKSDLLLVVLSRNWVERPWCGRELELFRARWRSDEDAKRRIIVVRKNQPPEDKVPPLLHGQEGYQFFELDHEHEAGQEQEFFKRGQIVDPRRYEKRLDELARFLWRAAARLVGPDREPPEKPALREPSVASNGRSIYLAKPGGDMPLAYDRLTQDLQGAGYTILPLPGDEIPHDASAVDFIDQALAAAEISIHLIGERPGYSPEDAEPIVKLQLARAAERAASYAGFRRVLWAPRYVAENEDGSAAAKARDPLEVVGHFCKERRLETDTIVGDNLSAFAEFLVQHLARTAQARRIPGPIPEGAKVYVYHRAEDEDYAVNLARALRERNLKADVPAIEGDPRDLEDFHRRQLRECTAVVLCWAKAPEVWARAACQEWSDLEKLGRTERFALRALVAGPPPSGRKKTFFALPEEADLVFDVTDVETPSPDIIDQIVRGAAVPLLL
jgi:hypothetical protein